MLPKVYLDEFCRLQDNVRTFSTVEARFVLEEGLGRPVDTVFEWLSEEPLAAASLGQVGVCSVPLGWRAWGVGWERVGRKVGEPCPAKVLAGHCTAPG